MKGLKAWAIDTGLRALKTAAQAAVALLTSNAIGLTQVPWLHILDVAALAGVVSILHNLSNLNVPSSSNEGEVNTSA